MRGQEEDPLPLRPWNGPLSSPSCERRISTALAAEEGQPDAKRATGSAGHQFSFQVPELDRSAAPSAGYSVH